MTYDCSQNRKRYSITDEIRDSQRAFTHSNPQEKFPKEGSDKRMVYDKNYTNNSWVQI